MATSTLDQIAASIVVALEDSAPGDVTPAAVRLMMAVAPGDRITVANAAIDQGADFNSVNKLIDSAGDLVGEVTPTRVDCATASPETIKLFNMQCGPSSPGAVGPGGGLIVPGPDATSAAASAASPIVGLSWSGLAMLLGVVGLFGMGFLLYKHHNTLQARRR